MEDALQSSVYVTSPEFAGWLMKKGFRVSISSIYSVEFYLYLKYELYFLISMKSKNFNKFNLALTLMKFCFIFSGESFGKRGG